MKFAVPMNLSIMFEIDAATAEEAAQKIQNAIYYKDDALFEEIRKEFNEIIDCRYIEIHDADTLEVV